MAIYGVRGLRLLASSSDEIVRIEHLNDESFFLSIPNFARASWLNFAIIFIESDFYLYKFFCKVNTYSFHKQIIDNKNCSTHKIITRHPNCCWLFLSCCSLFSVRKEKIIPCIIQKNKISIRFKLHWNYTLYKPSDAFSVLCLPPWRENWDDMCWLVVGSGS